MTWLDQLFYKYSSTSHVVNIDGAREHALFYKISGPSFDDIMSVLSGLNAWMVACTNVGKSCGKLYIVRSGGTGGLHMAQAAVLI